MNVAARTVAGVKRNRTLLPLLVVLFLIAYALLITMVIRQSRTINSQRTLIHLLYKDNLHLSALRKGQPVYGHPTANTQQNAASTPSAKIPVIQVPPSKAIPDDTGRATSSVKPREQAGLKTDRKARKAEKHLPAKPPAELTDPSDMRRVSFSI